jgi:hypothetical protein
MVSDRLRLFYDGGMCFYDDDKPKSSEDLPKKEPKKEAPNARPEPVEMSVYD